MGLETEIWRYLKSLTLRTADIPEDKFESAVNEWDDQTRPLERIEDMASPLYDMAAGAQRIVATEWQKEQDIKAGLTPEEMMEEARMQRTKPKLPTTPPQGLGLLYNIFEKRVREVFAKGVVRYVMTFEKGAPVQKKYTQNKRDMEAYATGIDKFPTTAFIRNGVIFDRAQKDAHGEPKQLEWLQYEMIVRSRALLPFLVEYLVEMLSKTSVIPEYASLVVDYRSTKGIATVLRLENNEVYKDQALANEWGEGECAAILWLERAYPEPVEIVSLDGDTAITLYNYSRHVHPDHEVFWRKGKRGKGETGDHVIDIIKYTTALCNEHWTADALIVASILCGNDFVWKQWVLKGVGSASIYKKCLEARTDLIPRLASDAAAPNQLQTALELLLRRIVLVQYTTNKAQTEHTETAYKHLTEGRDACGDDFGCPPVLSTLLWNIKYWKWPALSKTPPLDRYDRIP